MRSRGAEEALGKGRAAASPGGCPALSPARDIPSPRGAGSGSSRRRPEHLRAMHRPGTCSAARDAAGIEPVPRSQCPAEEQAATFPPSHSPFPLAGASFCTA